MVVDDDSGMLSTVTAILADAGYEGCGVDDGHQAIELASRDAFNLVFMDINLPGIDGVDAYRQIKSIAPGTPVIMMTGYSVEDLVSRALEEGAYTVLYKPFAIDRLLLAVKDVLDAPWVLADDYKHGKGESVKSRLEAFGYQVVLASNGNQAVSHAESRNYDVVLMDVGMPGIDGFEACRQIVKTDPSIKVIFMTDHDVNKHAREALMAGAFSLLSKPVEPKDLFALVDSLVGSADDADLGVDRTGDVMPTQS